MRKINWNPVSNDLPLEDSGDQDDPKWLGSPEGGRRVSELEGVPKGKTKSPERGQWSDGRGSIPRREKPPPRIPNPLGIPHPSYQPHPPNRWTLAGKANLSRKEVRKKGTSNNSLKTPITILKSNLNIQRHGPPQGFSCSRSELNHSSKKPRYKSKGPNRHGPPQGFSYPS